MCQLLDNILDRPFKVLPLAADSDVFKVVKVGPDYLLKNISTKFIAKVYWNGNDKFGYTFIVGNHVHVGDIYFKDLFFIEFDNETYLKTITNKEYAALRK